MGQTLTHGIYLPDEGERNCYSGLAGNWQILDNSVGTIAEHTTQIAGKAPLVHTHTKSDVTDLLNSNFVPSANNSYDLGSSSYQWNNLYAKNYYYNGTAWGLDKYNIWTNSQAYKLTGTEVGSTTSGYISLSFIDKNNANLGLQRASVYSDGRTCFSWKIYNTDNNSQSIRSSLEYYITKAEVKVFAPVENGEVNLGTSTNKWKSFNGINPGALSLPDNSKQLVVDTTGWDITGGTNVYTPPANGWLHIRVSGATELTVRWNDWRFGDRRVSATATDLGVTIPVVAGTTVDVVTVASGFVNKCTFFPCLGNV